MYLSFNVDIIVHYLTVPMQYVERSIVVDYFINKQVQCRTESTVSTMCYWLCTYAVLGMSTFMFVITKSFCECLVTTVFDDNELFG